MAKKQKRSSFSLVGMVVILILLGVLAVAMYATQQNTDSRSQAAAVSCPMSADGECVQKAAPAVKQAVLADQNVAACKAPVYMTVDYKHVGCIAGKPCDGYSTGKTLTTAVGWNGSRESDGPAKNYNGSRLRIPLTDSNGKWIKDNPVYRTSAKYNALGITRLGNGQVLISHQNANASYPAFQKTKSFQGIDAAMAVSGATIKNYTRGDNGIAPDQPKCIGGEPTKWGCVPGDIMYHGLELDNDNRISTWQSNYQNLLKQFGIGACGGDEFTKKSATSWDHYTRVCWPGDDYIMSFNCPTKPPLVKCNLYPIALSKSSVQYLQPNQMITDIWNGTGAGNFGWLTWNGLQSEPALSTSLTPPGNSYTYTNPKNSSDHLVSIGDYIQGRPGVTNSSGVRAALDKLKTVDVIVPVYDTSNCEGGSKSLYKTWKFAKVRLTSYDLAGGQSDGSAGMCSEKPGRNTITAKFLGFEENCIQ